MSAYKDDKAKTWYAYFRFTDWTGTRKQKMKRGFPTKRKALEWEREFLQKTAADLSMSFESFVEIYMNDMRSRIRESTMQTKENMIMKKLIPFFGKKKMNEIHTKDVIAWQNTLLSYRDANGKGYADTYLKSIHNQLSAILNHAVKHYDLNSNVAAKVGPVGKKEANEMLFWTKDEYLKFADIMMDKPISYYAFEILYWCGLRMGDAYVKHKLKKSRNYFWSLKKAQNPSLLAGAALS